MKHLLTVLLLIPISLQASELDSFYDQMRFLAQRDKIISENIANADTPKYQPKDLRKKSSKDADMNMSVTHPGHMDLDGGTGNFELTKAEILEMKPNGNAVTLENEMLKKSENSLRLMEATNLYNKSRLMLKTAINGSK